MKSFDYYSTNSVEYPNQSEYRKRLVQVINDTPMTAAERDEALEWVHEEARIWFKEAVKPYREEAARLEREFWQDCRGELGYDSFLNSDGVAALEYAAYERGHSAGYSDIYCCLIELAELAEKLVKNGKAA